MEKKSTQKLVIGAILTALVIILQYMGSFIKFGPFSISLVLIPIVIGTATCGKGIGAWLGFVFGIAVLITGDAAAFLAVNPVGTVVTVILKGILCGFVAGMLYEIFIRITKGNILVSTIISAIICPVVNTGIFLLGCLLFFMPTIAQWAEASGLGGNVGRFMIFVLVGGNFLFEIAVNIIFSPIIVRILSAVKKA